MFDFLPNSRVLTASKSVPFPSITCVCNTKAILSAFSLGKVSKNNLWAASKSLIHFLLILRELKNNIKSSLNQFYRY